MIHNDEKDEQPTEAVPDIIEAPETVDVKESVDLPEINAENND